jgi:hypothetical protein
VGEGEEGVYFPGGSNLGLKIYQRFLLLFSSFFNSNSTPYFLYTVIRFASTSAKFSMGPNGALVEAKIHTWNT